MPTETCRVPISNGKECGIDAVGRCLDDEAPFCSSHRAIVHGNVMTNVCTPCGEIRSRAVIAESTARQESLRGATKRIRDLAADLAVAVVPQESRQYQSFEVVKIKRGFFTRTEERQVVNDLAPAWSVGVFTWGFGRGGYVESRRDIATGVTSDGTVVPLAFPCKSESDQGHMNAIGIDSDETKARIADAMEQIAASGSVIPVDQARRY